MKLTILNWISNLRVENFRRVDLANLRKLAGIRAEARVKAKVDRITNRLKFLIKRKQRLLLGIIHTLEIRQISQIER